MSIDELFDTPRKVFFCNTNRKDSPAGELEDLMLSKEFAATWTEFSYEDHMKQVRLGDLIFLYAKKGADSIGGFVAVGVATGGV
ncbi:MAG: hypothetical protein KDB07_10810 [Planctomycetes bacterium]|nr:hypothetical protein [Planctomycetota bacterium]